MADRLDLVGDLFVTLAAIAKHRGISPATLPDCWTFEAGPWQVALNATSTAHVAHGIKVAALLACADPGVGDRMADAERELREEIARPQPARKRKLRWILHMIEGVRRG